MKNLKTFENWTSDIKRYFDTGDNGEFDYDSWYETWEITKSRIDTENNLVNGYILFKYLPLEPDWDESPTFTEVEWKLKDDKDFFYETSDSSLDRSDLEWTQELEMIYYIMFEDLTDDNVRIKWFNNEKSYFNDSAVELVYDGKYLEQYKELKKKSSLKKFKI